MIGQSSPLSLDEKRDWIAYFEVKQFYSEQANATKKPSNPIRQKQQPQFLGGEIL